MASAGTAPAALRAACLATSSSGMPAGLTVRRTGEATTASSRRIQSSGARSAVMASPAAAAKPHGQLGRAAGARLGRPDGGFDGLLHPAIVQCVGDAGEPLLPQRRRPLVQRLLERLGHGAPLLVEVDRTRGGHDGPELTQPVVLPRRQGDRGPVLPVGQAHGRQQFIGHGQERLRRHRRLPRRLVRGVLRFDGLPDGLQAAAEELLGHGDLFGPQGRQHGVAVHGGRRCDRSLTPRRAAVALAGTSAAGTTRSTATARRSVAAALVAPSLAIGTAALAAASAVSIARRRHRAAACPSPEPK